MWENFTTSRGWSFCTYCDAVGTFSVYLYKRHLEIIPNRALMWLQGDAYSILVLCCFVLAYCTAQLSHVHYEFAYYFTAAWFTQQPCGLADDVIGDRCLVTWLSLNLAQSALWIGTTLKQFTANFLINAWWREPSFDYVQSVCYSVIVFTDSLFFTDSLLRLRRIIAFTTFVVCAVLFIKVWIKIGVYQIINMYHMQPGMLSSRGQRGLEAKF